MPEVNPRELEAMHRRLDDEEIFLASRSFWNFARHIRTDDADNGVIRKFPTPDKKTGEWKHLIQMVNAMATADRVAIKKSGRIFCSQTLLAFYLWLGKYSGTEYWGKGSVFHGGYMATNEGLSEEQMGKLQIMHDNLPPHFQRFNPITVNNKLEKIFQSGGRIHAFAGSRIGTHGWTFSHFTFDEIAFHESARQAWMGVASRSRKLFVVSTPNGTEGNGRFFYELFEGLIPSARGFVRLNFCDPSLHPEHASQEWRDNHFAGMSQEQIEQHFYGQWVIFSGSRVWKEFSREGHVSETKFIPGRTVYVGFDLGYQHPAIIFAQRNHKDQWLFHHEVIGEEESFDTFSARAAEVAAGLYRRSSTPEVLCLPPDVRQRYRSLSASGASNDYQVLFGFTNPQNKPVKGTWIRPDGSYPSLALGAKDVGTRQNEGPRLKTMRRLFNLRKDGQYGIVISPNCPHFIDGCGGGYQYPEKGDSEEPAKNIYSHIQDAAQTIVSSYQQMIDPDMAADRARKRRERIGFRTGM
jgi:hypothetical protein